jgi:prevent-host-death family protein
MKIASTGRVLRIVPALAARTQFGQILDRVRRNHERFVVDKRGEPLAVIMSVEEYLKHFARQPLALERIHRIAKSKLSRLSARTINLEIKRHRRSRRKNA